MNRKFTLVLALAAASGCESQVSGPLGSGDWGGTGVSMTVQSTGTLFEFDCAHGSLEQGLTVTGSRFSERGVYVRERGGPIGENEEIDEIGAVYSGEIRGGTMTLYVKIDDRDEPNGPYLLSRGAPANLRKCL